MEGRNRGIKEEKRKVRIGKKNVLQVITFTTELKGIVPPLSFDIRTLSIFNLGFFAVGDIVVKHASQTKSVSKSS